MVTQRAGGWILTKPGVGRELQDLLVLWGKEALSGGTSPLPLSLNPVLGMSSIQGRQEAPRPHPWVWGTSRAVGGHRVMGQGGAGPCTHVNPLSQKLLQHLATQQPQLHGGLKGEAFREPHGPLHPPMLGAGPEDRPRDQSPTACSDGQRAPRPQPQGISPPCACMAYPQPRPPHHQEDPVHLTILASVLISARTQSGQSRSPQNRNLCTGGEWSGCREG